MKNIIIYIIFIFVGFSFSKEEIYHIDLKIWNEFQKNFLYEEEEYAYAKKSYGQGKNLEALSMLSRLRSDYPQGIYYDDALFLAGYIYKNNLKQLDSAKVYYNRLLEFFPSSEFIPSVKFELETLHKKNFIPKLKD